MNWYLAVLGKYAVFKGRASRKEFWCFLLFTLVIVVCCFRLDLYVFAHTSNDPSKFLPIISWIYTLAMVIPFLAVLVRRLHDVGLSAWWLLLLVVPLPLPSPLGLMGFIALLCLALMRSEPRGNKYG